MASVTSACTSRIFKGVFCQLQKTVGFTSYVPSLLAGFGCLVLDGKLCRQSSTWRLRKEPTMSPRLTCQTRILKSTAFRFSIAIFSKFVSLNGPAFRVTNACRNSNFSLYPTIAQWCKSSAQLPKKSPLKNEGFAAANGTFTFTWTMPSLIWTWDHHKCGMEIMTKFCCRKMVQTNLSYWLCICRGKSHWHHQPYHQLCYQQANLMGFWFPLGWYWI